MTEITPWHWAGFVLFVILCIAVDMGAFNRRACAGTAGGRFRQAVGS